MGQLREWWTDADRGDGVWHGEDHGDGGDGGVGVFFRGAEGAGEDDDGFFWGRYVAGGEEVVDCVF